MKSTIKLLSVVALSFCFSATAWADLRPSEVAIIAVQGSRESEQLAEYYAKKRGIPEENICKVVMPKGETISHEKWKWAVRPEIRKWLQDHDPSGNLRCLVTTWDVPLKIGKDKGDSPAFADYKEYLEGERAKRIKVLRDIVAEFGLLAPGIALPIEDEQLAPTTDSADASPATEEQKSDFEKLQIQLEKELQRAQQRAGQLSDPQEQQQAAAKVQQYAMGTGGTRLLLQSLSRHLQNSDPPDPAVKSDFQRLRGMAIAYAQMKSQLEQLAPGIQRDGMLLDVLSRAGGLLASVTWIDEQLKGVAKNETGASFDSELSLVLWPDDYQLLRWQPNYLRANYDNSQLRDTYRTLMVARLDAPTLRLAKGLIDTALRVEAEGLVGKVYLDGRGIGKLDGKSIAPGSYADYDRALLITAKGLKEQTSLEVVLDEKSQLFQPGECPDAALYCGWYSLAKYVDAFDWAPGAVAYHLASSEATTLRNEKSQVWCKRMLEDGVCATIGPVYEPYLMAFPRPNEFFALLIRGELSLVECFYRTKPYNSWMMTLIGDPLYRPYAKSNAWN